MHSAQSVKDGGNIPDSSSRYYYSPNQIQKLVAGYIRPKHTSLTLFIDLFQECRLHPSHSMVLLCMYLCIISVSHYHDFKVFVVRFFLIVIFILDDELSFCFIVGNARQIKLQIVGFKGNLGLMLSFVVLLTKKTFSFICNSFLLCV